MHCALAAMLKNLMGWQCSRLPDDCSAQKSQPGWLPFVAIESNFFAPAWSNSAGLFGCFR
jgi:hypothetical protein